jgi:predicted dinucleotide-binding enzyme
MSSYSIIGSGAIGGALAGHFVSQGIEVSSANNRGPASMEDLVRRLPFAARSRMLPSAV